MMRNAGITRSNIYKIAAVILAFVFVASSFFFLLSLWERGNGFFPSADLEPDYLKHNGKKYVLKDDIEAFLILGLDKFDEEGLVDSYNNDKSADFLMLYVFDKKAKTYSALHINRDTIAKVNVLGVAGDRVDTVEQQIALAHTYGNGKEVSCRNTADAVSELLLGVRINHYLSMTMDAVSQLNDMVGGVEVEILDDLTAVDRAFVKGQRVTLNGEQALKYVRSRQGLEDSTNITRMGRQRQYVNALMQKALDRFANDDEFLVESTLKLSDYIVSDRSLGQLQDLFRRFSTYEFTQINTIEGESEVGERFMEFHPNEASVKENVIDLFYEPKS